LNFRYPQLTSACKLHPLQMNINSPEFQRGDFLLNDQGKCEFNAILVCLDDDSLGLHTGLTLLNRLRAHKIPIIVRMAEKGGLATLLQREEDGSGYFDNLSAFALLDRTCTPDILLGGSHEILARALHEEHVRQQGKLGTTARDNPILRPWEELLEDQKEENRRQADRIGVILNSIGYRIEPLTDWEADEFQFSPQDIEEATRMEHDNRVSIRELPALLAEAGFQIYRKK
jgi:hypothetical protein